MPMTMPSAASRPASLSTSLTRSVGRAPSARSWPAGGGGETKYRRDPLATSPPDTVQPGDQHGGVGSGQHPDRVLGVRRRHAGTAPDPADRKDRGEGTVAQPARAGALRDDDPHRQYGLRIERGSGPAQITALDVKSGDILWQSRRESAKSQLVLADGKVLDQDGVLTLASPSPKSCACTSSSNSRSSRSFITNAWQRNQIGRSQGITGSASTRGESR